MILYELLDGTQTGPLVGEIRDLYAEVFAEPPYGEGPSDVARFVEHLGDERTRPGFGLARAVDGPVLVGVAYGWTMPPGRWFSKPTTEPPPEIRGVPHYGVMEWMVRSSQRGGGVGRQLMDLLLASRPEAWAVLASNPDALARRIYERWGWRPVGTTKSDTMPPMDILALPLGRVA